MEKDIVLGMRSAVVVYGEWLSTGGLYLQISRCGLTGHVT